MILSKFHKLFGIPVIMFHGLCTKLPAYAVFSDSRTGMLEENDFCNVVEWISRHFQVIRLEDLDGDFRFKRWKRPPILLTFDDGLASVIDLACPILENYRMSATVFVTTEWIDSERTPYIFLLEKAVWQSIPVNLFIHVADKSIQLRINSKEEISRAFTKIWNFLFEIRFPPLKISHENVKINGQTRKREEIIEDRYFWYPASWKELRSAAQAGVLEIGSHMISHTPLTWLSDEEKLFQLKHSRDKLSKMIGSLVTACSYPHGHIDKKTISMSERIYKWGFTNRPGCVRNTTNRNAAPRYHVPGEAPEHIIETLRWGRTISRFKRVIFS